MEPAIRNLELDNRHEGDSTGPSQRTAMSDR